ncbi:P-loop containing nucleoside triphosphate hydrolase protein [Entophlyctis helioformis]|nr:P-loop containing nucleoside triphosphate hydrolase protein [Entophlyctis helioformis]
MVAVGKNKHRKRPAGAANRKANGKTVLAAAARTDTDAFDPSLSLDDILEMEEQQSQSASSNSNKRMRTSKSSSSQDDSDNDNADDDAEVDADAVAVAGGKRKDPFEDAVDVEELLYGDVDFDLDSFVNIDDFKEDPSVLNPKAAQRAKAKAEAVSPSAKRLKRISDSDPVSRGYAADVVADDDGGLDADADDDDEDDAEQQEADKKADNQTNNKKPVFDFPAVPRSSPWNAFGLHASIVSNLVHHLGFPKPTDIQSQTLSQTLLHHHDVIGAAETGSGKTLAYGLPILQHIATVLPTDPDMPCAGLIIAPTRELALQVADHLRKAGRGITHKVVAVVGGMSSQKQKRQLASGPHVLVATPGRLWELMQDDDMLMDALQHVKFLVIDEADRMLEAGHFRDLDEILARISVARLPHDQAARIKRRTLVFSATMLEDASLQQILTQAKKKAAKGKKRFGNTLFGKLLDKVSFRDEHPVYINLSTKNVVAKGLLEAKIDCLKTQKDAMLYYVLTRYPGKTIVFANSIDAIRRLVPILTVLRVPAFGLHAEMQQRQRLKSLDRFRESENAVLVASDVAARGLDIPAVDHVVHYQLPRSADVYVHRSGRTARAMTEGVSVALVCPEELTMYKKVCHVLKKGE